ncbi:MAG: hypothetical protein WC635_06020 [Bacteriovorax sp.]|jgi:pimeloyl-ACP methyl ester carboxylesterase
MKVLMTLFFIFPSIALAFKCPESPNSFSPQKINYRKVFLVPGAGADEDELYLGYIRYGKYFSIYSSELKKRKIPFEVISTFPTGNENIGQRVEKLAEKIKNEPLPVLVIGHSIGGLVSRLVLRRPDIARKIAATVTISSPHQGTPLADWFLTDGPHTRELKILSKAFGFDLSQKAYIKEISVMNKGEWNTDLDHASHIHNIFSVLSSQRPRDLMFSNAFFAAGDNVIRELVNSDKEYVSDGIVPVESQIWGECLLFEEENHGSIIGKDVFHFPTRDVLPNILNKLDQREIHFQR